MKINLKWVLAIFIVLWLAGVIKLPFLGIPIFDVFGRPFTIHHLLILLFVGYIIRFLPSMLQTVVVILLILWLLSTFIFFSFGGLANLFIIILIIAILFSFI